MSEIEMYDSKSHNKRCNQINQKAWLIWSGVDDGAPIYDETFTALDEDTALELFMSLVEEEMEETFFWMTQDEYERPDEDWERRAKEMKLRDTTYIIMEVTAIGTICC